MDEIRGLLERMDHAADLTGPAGGTEYGLAEGYRLWSETYDHPLRLFPLEEPVMHRLFDSLRRRLSFDESEPAGTAGSWPRAATGSSESIARPRCWRRPVAASERASFREGSLNVRRRWWPGRVDAVVRALALVHLPDVDEAVRGVSRAWCGRAGA